MSSLTHIQKIDKYGFCVLPNVYSDNLINDVINDFRRIKNAHTNIQKKKNMNSSSHDVCFHTIIDSDSHLLLFEKNIISEILEKYFQGNFILNTMSISELVPETHIYTKRIHRDIRSFQGASQLWMQVVILLTDSNYENGATWLLPKDKNTVDEPSKNYFFNNAIQVEAKKGDVMLFDPNLWHCSGDNKSSDSRIIMTPVFSKPFIKQQFDYVRAFGPKFFKNNSNYLSQILGYNSRTPQSLDEFYQKNPEERFYKPNQG